MTCEEATDLVVDSLMDRLDPSTKDALATHLEGCARCAAETEELRRLWTGLGALGPPEERGMALVRFGQRVAARARPSWRMRGLRIAAGVALLVGAGMAGRWSVRSSPAGAAEASEYLFLLRGGEPDRRAPAEQLVAEYSRWAGTLASAGSLVLGEELSSDSARWVRPTVSQGDTSSAHLSGFFVVRAPDIEAAVAMARTSPHVAHGGIVEVRGIVRGNAPNVP